MKVNYYLQQSLGNLGLSEGESIIYLQILNNPGLNAAYLKQATPFSMAGIYKILRSLSDKGFIISSKESPFTYTAISMEQLGRKLAAKGRKLQRISDKLNELSRLSKMPEDVEVYNYSNLIDFYLSLPSKIDDFIWCVGSFEAVMNFFGPEVEKDFIRSRSKKGARADALIFDNSEYSKTLAGRDAQEKRETRIISCGDYPLEFTYLFGDTFLNFYKDSDGKIKVLKSESPEIARAKLLQYQILWNSTQE